MLLLSSYDRMRRFLASADGVTVTDTVYKRQAITNMVTAVSKQIEKFLNRDLAYGLKTEYFDVEFEKEVEFFVSAWPISTLTSVYFDPEGLWDGGESELSDCFIGKNDDSIVLSAEPINKGRKAMRAIYTGGLAVNGTKSVFATSNVVGTWSVGSFAKGGTTESVGIVKSVAASALTIENLYGIFEAGETLTEYTTEALTTSDATATLSAITSQSLAETYPDITRAAEMQIRYLWKHKDDIELTGTSRDATNTRREGEGRPPATGGLIREAIGLLAPYRKVNA